MLPSQYKFPFHHQTAILGFYDARKLNLFVSQILSKVAVINWLEFACTCLKYCPLTLLCCQRLISAGWKCGKILLWIHCGEMEHLNLNLVNMFTTGNWNLELKAWKAISIVSSPFKWICFASSFKNKYPLGEHPSIIFSILTELFVCVSHCCKRQELISGES